MRGSILRRGAAAAALSATLLAVSACRQDMHDQPKYEPLEASAFFDDGRASRPIPRGTVARGQLSNDMHYATGKVNGAFVTTFPRPVDRAMILRGRERYDIYCSPCHDRTGSGNGMIVQRGYQRPPSFHEARVRSAPVGQIFSAITDGFGVMPSYATQIPIEDRWAIVAYIRALQLSQHAELADVEPAKRAILEAQKGAAR